MSNYLLAGGEEAVIVRGNGEVQQQSLNPYVSLSHVC